MENNEDLNEESASVGAEDSDDHDTECNEDIDADPEDCIFTDLKNLFPDLSISPAHSQSSQENELPVHSENSQEYFSPVEDIHDNPSPSSVSTNLKDKEEHESASKQTIRPEYQKLLNNGSPDNHCNMPNLKSVSVQCEPLKLVTQAVQSDPIIQVTQAVQYEYVLQVSRGVQCEPVLQVEQSVQCSCESLQSTKEESKFIRKSPPEKDTPSKANVTSVGVNCDLINIMEVQQSSKGECFVSRSQIDLPPLLGELDASNVVSSSQTSLYICDTSCGSPEMCDLEILSESSNEHSPPNDLAKCHKESNVNHHYAMQDNSSSLSKSAENKLVEDKSAKRKNERKTRRLENSKRTVCAASPSNTLEDSISVHEYSSQELLLEMGTPVRPSQSSGENNKCVSKSAECSGIPRMENCGQKSLSAQQNTLRSTDFSTLGRTQKMDSFPFNSMACERASSPESLDEEECNELTKISTFRPPFSKVQSKDTNSLICNDIVRKETSDKAPSKSGNKQHKTQTSSEESPVKRKPHFSTLGGTQKMNSFPFNSMTCERASSPESLDEDECNELTKISFRPPFSKVHSKDTDSLRCNDIVRKETHDKAPSKSGNKRQHETQTSSEESPVKRKRMSPERNNTSALTVSSKSIKHQQLVPYSDSDCDNGHDSASPDPFHSFDSSDSSLSRTTVVKVTQQMSTSSLRKSNTIAKSTTSNFSGQQKSTSPARSIDSDFQRSTSSRHTRSQSVKSSASRRRLNVTDVELTDSESDIETASCSRSVRSKLSQRSRAKRPYTNREREAIVLYIIDHKYFKRVKGNKLWELMERAKICPNRTWQSLKEHFRKQILPKIETFHLNSVTEKKFISLRW